MLVIVTGADRAAAPVRSELEQSGATVVTVATDADFETSLGGKKADAYVQLPTLLAIDGTPGATTLVERVGRFLSDGLLMRFRLAAAVLPHLTEDARVILVGGNTPVPGTGVDDQSARVSLLRVLAHALRAEEAPRRLRVRVLEHDSTPQSIAKTACGEQVDRPPAAGPPAGDSDVDISYADWRTEVLGLAHVEF
jgi:hypothetical protein